MLRDLWKRPLTLAIMNRHASCHRQLCDWISTIAMFFLPDTTRQTKFSGRVSRRARKTEQAQESKNYCLFEWLLSTRGRPCLSRLHGRPFPCSPLTTGEEARSATWCCAEKVSRKCHASRENRVPKNERRERSREAGPRPPPARVRPARIFGSHSHWAPAR